MSNKMKIIFYASVFINITGLFGALFLPQYRMIGSDNQIFDDKLFNVGGYVEGMNFQEPGVNWMEYYLIFGTYGENFMTGAGKYYYMNGVMYDSNGSWIPNKLKELNVKSNTIDKMELFDNSYSFEIYKKTGKVLGKDIKGDTFELKNTKKTYGYEWLLN